MHFNVSFVPLDSAWQTTLENTLGDVFWKVLIHTNNASFAWEFQKKSNKM